MAAVRALDAAAVLALLAALALLCVVVRRRLLERGGGVACSVRLRTASHGRGWVLGVGRYDDEELRWYRVFSAAPRPRRTFSRRDLSVQRQRHPVRPEALALLEGSVVLECRSGSKPVQIAMNEAAVAGFLAWLESAPPGAAVYRE